MFQEKLWEHGLRQELQLLVLLVILIVSVQGPLALAA